MRIATSARSVSATFVATACVALAACSGSNGAPPSPPLDAGGGIIYWLAPRTSEVDLQLVPIQPTQGF